MKEGFTVVVMQSLRMYHSGIYFYHRVGSVGVAGPKEFLHIGQMNPMFTV